VKPEAFFDILSTKYWSTLDKKIHKNAVKKQEAYTKSVPSKIWFIFGYP
jgi:hypothetical protein